MSGKLELKVLHSLNRNTQIIISEEYEYSHEKAERVSLPHKNARIQLFITANKTKQTENKNK